MTPSSGDITAEKVMNGGLNALSAAGINMDKMTGFIDGFLNWVKDFFKTAGLELDISADYIVQTGKNYVTDHWHDFRNSISGITDAFQAAAADGKLEMSEVTAVFDTLPKEEPLEASATPATPSFS